MPFSSIKKGWTAGPPPAWIARFPFALNSAKFIPALFALYSYSVATWLYPAVLVVANGGVSRMLAVRRWRVRVSQRPFAPTIK